MYIYIFLVITFLIDFQNNSQTNIFKADLLQNIFFYFFANE